MKIADRNYYPLPGAEEIAEQENNAFVWGWVFGAGFILIVEMVVRGITV